MIPELAGKLHGFAVRAPIATGSVVDLTFEADRATSVEDLASEARLTTGALYHHFPNKTALFEAVFVQVSRPEVAVLQGTHSGPR